MSHILDFDVIIFGSGVAGLWSLARLRQAGYAALLLESKRLGGIQTIASQGIIHGGTKYALTGHLSNSAQAIGAMPEIWRSCLAGTGELDLSRVKILTKHQCLWSTGSLGSAITSLLASKAMRSRVVALDPAAYPAVLQNPNFRGHVYQLEEPVLDMATLVQSLAHHGGNDILWLNPKGKLHIEINNGQPLLQLTDPKAGSLLLRARRLILAAGAGNQQLLAQLGQTKPAMQRRPLHMLMLRAAVSPFYAHCLGVSTNPRLTITSHSLQDGQWVWYLGGQIAESGVTRSPQDQITVGQRELAEILPWLDLSKARWSSFLVERAEPKQPHGLRPDRAFLETKNGISVAWPTKLAFAPALSAVLLEDLRRDGIKPSGAAATIDWPRPPPPQLPWDTCEW